MFTKSLTLLSHDVFWSKAGVKLLGQLIGCPSVAVQFLDSKGKWGTRHRLLVNTVVYIVKMKERKMNTELYTWVLNPHSWLVQGDTDSITSWR